MTVTFLQFQLRICFLLVELVLVVTATQFLSRATNIYQILIMDKLPCQALSATWKKT